ncbi:MAG: hypothetical protein LAO20_10375 [Acidobacteriia bacterium]|nr:hypothetical protein [Terriglobia bacterium]
MAKTTLASLLLAITLSIIAGCGGCSLAPPQTSTPKPSAITVTWQFQDGNGYHMWIDRSSLGCAFGVCDSDLQLWHFHKDHCESYWNGRTPAQCAVATHLDELWFVLHHDADGAWRCIGFNYVDYLSRKWKVQILTVAGHAPGYTIIPASVTASDPPTSYDAIVQRDPPGDISSDFTPPPGAVNFSSSWQTVAGLEQFTSAFTGTVSALMSHQHEGCLDEHWDFVNGEPVFFGALVGIGDNADCIPLPPAQAMVRVR